jgi:hypothetical protein
MVVLEILSPLPLTNRSDGQDFLELWQTHLPELLPDRYGNWEPIDRKFDSNNIGTALDHWVRPFLTAKKRPRSDASVFMRRGAFERLHAIVVFCNELGAAPQEHLLNFLAAASLRLKADFAYLHLTTEPELHLGRANNTAIKLNKQGTSFMFSVPSVDLQRRIPDLYWATVLGAPYLNLFGNERVLSSPAYSSVRLSDNAVLLQLTEKLADVEQNYEAFCHVRSDVKTHLGKDAFFSPAKEYSHFYRVPEFMFFDAEGK